MGCLFQINFEVKKVLELGKDNHLNVLSQRETKLFLEEIFICM